MMDDTPYPMQHTTTVTRTDVETTIRYDDSYIHTLGGKLKLAQIALSLLSFLCLSFSRYSLEGRGAFFSTVSAFAFWWSTVLLFMYLFHIIEKFYKVPWLKVEIIACSFCAAFYLLASLLAFAYVSLSAVFGFAAIFGLATMLVYGYDGYVKLQAYQRGEIAQGSRVVSKEVTDVSTGPPPRY